MAPGECEIYDVYEIVAHPCSRGDFPGECYWETGGTLGFDPSSDYLPYWTIDVYTVFNCAMPNFPGGGGGGGGGGTTPNPPPDYDPCQPVAVASSGVKVQYAEGTTPCVPLPQPTYMPTGDALIAYKISLHKAIMRNAAKEAGLCDAAIDELVSGVAETDYDTLFGLVPGTSTFHFDDLHNFTEIKNNWNLLSPAITNSQQNDWYTYLGKITHAYQDFYAHSNYAEILIKYYGDDSHIVPFSTVLSNVGHQYDGLLVELQNNLKTGSFDLITWAFGKYGADLQNIDYTTTHSYINKDNANTFAGDYSLRLAQKETFKIVSGIKDKCQ